MDKSDYQLEDFIAAAGAEHAAFVTGLDGALRSEGYKAKVESKPGGMFVSYAHPKTRRSVLNLLVRRKGLAARVYADNLARYAGFVNDLPEAMAREIEKGSVCKRLINPDDCNPKCVMGYDFMIEGRRYQKCRYHCFEFTVTADTAPVIAAFVEHERAGRRDA